MTLKVNTATGTEYTVMCLPEQGVFIVRNICKTCVRYFSCSFIGCLHDPANVHQTSSKCIQNTLANAGRLLLYVIMDKPAGRLLDRVNTPLLCSCLHHLAVSPLTNRFLSVTGNRRLGFGQRWYGRFS